MRLTPRAILLLIIIILLLGWGVLEGRKYLVEQRELVEINKQKLPDYFIKSEDNLRLVSEETKKLAQTYPDETIESGVSYMVNQSLKEAIATYIDEANKQRLMFVKGSGQDEQKATYHLREGNKFYFVILEKITDSTTRVSVLYATAPENNKQK